MSKQAQCWNCGESLDVKLDPLAREERCKFCNAQLHACRMCEFYDGSRLNSCLEPVAEIVSDKTKANFCGYFKINMSAYDAGKNQAQEDALAELDALFGNEGGGENTEDKVKDEQQALSELNRLFGADSDDTNNK